MSGKLKQMDSWLIALLLLSCLFLNYLDRQSLSVLARFLPSELKMSNIAYAHITSAFLLAYALSMPLAGWFVDRLGTRLGLAITVSAWSFFEVLCGTARSAMALGSTVSFWASPKLPVSRLSSKWWPSMRPLQPRG